MLNRRAWMCAAVAAMAACFADVAVASSARPVTRRPVPRELVSLTVERPGGWALPLVHRGGQAWLAGADGERYNLRLTNRTGERLEVVVTVDGRDVIDGELGDFRRKRGYVLEPYASMVVEGFRQSFDNVAAFRFTGIADSYTTLMGTPQHNGVIGMAVFRERRARRREQPRPLSPSPAPLPSPGRSKAAPGASAQGRRDAPEPSAPWSPGAPQQLGTEYGETMYSPVREVRFVRRHRRRPDQLTTIFYDSLAGLRARGIWIDSAPAPHQPLAFPESHRRFAPPPPR